MRHRRLRVTSGKFEAALSRGCTTTDYGTIAYLGIILELPLI